MARELNVESKHSIERQTAMNVDCFTTVSDVTARECAELLDKPCDAVLENGFEPDFVPAGAAFTARRRQARTTILQVASALTGTEMTARVTSAAWAASPVRRSAEEYTNAR